MSKSYVQRFTIGHAMALTAVFAVLFYAGFVNIRTVGPYAPLLNPTALVGWAISIALIAVCFVHRSLSVHLRLALAGLIGSLLSHAASIVAFGWFYHQSPPFLDPTLLRLPWVFWEFFTILYIYGLFLTFEDLRRRLDGARNSPDSGQSRVGPLSTGRDEAGTAG